MCKHLVVYVIIYQVLDTADLRILVVYVILV